MAQGFLQPTQSQNNDFLLPPSAFDRISFKGERERGKTIAQAMGGAFRNKLQENNIEVGNLSKHNITANNKSLNKSSKSVNKSASGKVKSTITQHFKNRLGPQTKDGDSLEDNQEIIEDDDDKNEEGGNVDQREEEKIVEKDGYEDEDETGKEDDDSDEDTKNNAVGPTDQGKTKSTGLGFTDKISKIQNKIVEDKKKKLDIDPLDTDKNEKKGPLGKSIKDALQDALEAEMLAEELKRNEEELKKKNEDEKDQGQDNQNDKNKEQEDDEYAEQQKQELENILNNIDAQAESSLFSIVLMIIFVVHLVLEVQIGKSTGINKVCTEVLFNSYYDKTTQKSVFNITDAENLETAIAWLFDQTLPYKAYDLESQELIRNSNRNYTLNCTDPTSSDYEDCEVAYAIGKYNLFTGIRMTTINANVYTNTDENSKHVLPQVRDEVYMQVDSSASSINKTLSGYNYSETGGYKQNGGFIMFIPGDTVYGDALTILEQNPYYNFKIEFLYREMKNASWFRNQMIQTTMEIMIYNKNALIGINYEVKFFKSNTGNFLVEAKHYVFLPQNYIELTTSTFVKFSLMVVYALLILYLFLSNTIRFYKKLRVFCSTKQYEIEWHIYLDLLICALSFIQMIYWARIFIMPRNNFNLPISDEAEFDYWVQNSYDFQNYLRMSALIVWMFCARILRVISQEFPAFGVLFDTISQAKMDLTIFLVFTCILIINAMMMEIGFFGNYIERYSTGTSAFISILQQTYDENQVKIMGDVNEIFSYFYFIFFCITFFYIVLNFFSVMLFSYNFSILQALMLNTYDGLRKRKQIVVEAMARVIAQEARKEQKKWLNLILCRVGQVKKQDNESDEEDKQQKEDNNSEQRQMSLKTKIQFNLIQIFKPRPAKTREQYDNKLQKIIKQIKQERREAIRKRKANFIEIGTKENYHKLKLSFLFLIYILVFVIMVLYQTNNKSSQQVTEAIKEIMKHQEFNQSKRYSDVESLITYYDIIDVRDMQDFLYQVIYPFIMNTNSLNQQANIAVGKYAMRFSFRFVNNSKNEDDSTNDCFPGKHNTWSLNFQESDDTLYEEIKSDFNVGNRTMVYIPPGNPKTFNQLGGFTLQIEQNATMDYLKENIYDIDWLYYGVRIYCRQFLSQQLGELVVDFVVYNPNYRKYMYSSLMFQINGAGYVDPSVNCITLYINHYTSENAFVITMEFIYFGLSAFYVVKMSKELKQIWLEESKKKGKVSAPQKSGKCIRFFYWMNIDYYALVKRRQGVLLVLQITLKIITFIFMTFYKSLVVIWKKISSSTLESIECLQLFLSLISILWWIIIVSFQGFNKQQCCPIDMIAPSNILASHQEGYKIVQNLQSFFIFISVLQFFTFSKKFSEFIEIMYSAKFELVFFMVIFSFLLVAYGFAGFLLFGASIDSFESVFQAIFELLIFLRGNFEYDKLKEVDFIMNIVYYISFLVILKFHNVHYLQLIFQIIYLNMFIGILAAHYNELKKHSDDSESVSFFKVVYTILKANVITSEKNPNFKQRILRKIFGTQNIDDQKKAVKQVVQQDDELNAILKERLEQPNVYSNKFNLGLKLFIDDFNVNEMNEQIVERMENNVNFYKKSEEKGIETQIYNNANYWIYLLEDFLSGFAEKLSLYDFQSDYSVLKYNYDSMDGKLLTPQQITFLNIPKKDWQARIKYIKKILIKDDHKLYELWKALMMEKYLAKIHKIEKELQEQSSQGQKKVDFGVLLLKFQQGLITLKQIKEMEIDTIKFNDLQISKINDPSFQRVPKFCAYLWNTIFTKNKKFLLWFEKFSTSDRVKLWNTLVFSQNYFLFVANCSKYQRVDIKNIMTKIQAKIKQESLKVLKEVRKQSKNSEKCLSPTEIYEIKSLYYNAKVQQFVWKEIRKTEILIPPDENRPADRGKVIPIPKKQYGQMINDMFALMVGGLGNQRLTKIKQISEKLLENGQKMNKGKVYEILCDQMFDPSEERLQLWLMMDHDQKLDMLLQQGIQEEAEIMVFLLEQEFNYLKKIANNEEAMEKIERSLDGQIFDKYFKKAEIQALNHSIKQSKVRLYQQYVEDQSIFQYAKYLNDKVVDYEQLLSKQDGDKRSMMYQNQILERQINHQYERNEKFKQKYSSFIHYEDTRENDLQSKLATGLRKFTILKKLGTNSQPQAQTYAGSMGRTSIAGSVKSKKVEMMSKKQLQESRDSNLHTDKSMAQIEEIKEEESSLSNQTNDDNNYHTQNNNNKIVVNNNSAKKVFSGLKLVRADEDFQNKQTRSRDVSPDLYSR